MIRLHRYALAAAALLLALPAAAHVRDAEVTAVSVVSAPGRADLVIDVRGAVDVKDFVLANPARLVIDLSGARLSGSMAAAYDGLNRAGIVNVRYAQFSAEVVRVVVELDALRDYQVDRTGEAVRVSFGADRPFVAWSSTAPGALPAAAAAAPAPRGREVTPAPDPAPRTQQSPDRRMTVSWDKADILDVLAGFAAFSGRTIVPGKGVEGEVTAEIRDQPWPMALQAVLAAQGLSAQEMPGGIIRVDSPEALSALDSLEPLQTRIVKLNYAKAAEVAKSTEGILTKGRGSMVPDTALNSLIITDTRRRLDEIATFVSSLDIRTPQVSIQAKIIFVDRTDLLALGFQYDLGDDNQFFNRLVQRPDPANPGETYDPNQTVVDLGGNTVSAIGNAEASIPQPALEMVWSTALGGFSLTTFLQALERVELADIQAEPLITTLDNRKADILVGEETPVRIVDYSSGGTGSSEPRATVQFKETGIRLTVTPRVTNNGQVLMELETERSAVQQLAAADLGFNIQTQRATNQLLVNDGETAVIGGLTVTTVQKLRSGIPLLSSLPVVGPLFSFTNNSENRKDLIILVTPRILDDGLASAN